ncbi:MAG: hypothetical protein PHE15_05345 [Dehalococcoidales bacterium]|nr:hypothetical protein [Dehalococcoidales bacterium]
MAQVLKVDKLILNGIKMLSGREKEQLLNYIEFLKIKEDRDFIEYVNMRTKEAIESKKKGGEVFFIKRTAKRICIKPTAWKSRLRVNSQKSIKSGRMINCIKT